MEEPSVLDFIKSKLNPFDNKGTITLRKAMGLDGSDDIPETGIPENLTTPGTLSQVELIRHPWPWKLMAAFAAAIIAQMMLEPPRQSSTIAIGLYGIASVLIILSLITHEFSFPARDTSIDIRIFANNINPRMLYICIPFLLLAFLALGGNQFNFLNLILWLSALLFGALAFWDKSTDSDRKFASRLKKYLADFPHGVSVRITSWSILLILAFLMAAFFRFYRLEAVPAEMFSDHAEKLMDVSDVIDGQYSIFFPRNTGREAFQMYLTALAATIFGTGLSFTSLKIGTALAGFFTLPYIYLLGKELGNKWVGLLALLLAGMAYWPNVISRVALRFSLYPLFTAPVLYYLIRGLRRSCRNDFILAGIALGMGLHGYSPMRIVPLVVILGVIIYLLHNRRREKVIFALWGLLILAFMAMIVFFPLLRYMLDQPEMFSYRLFSRLGTTERIYPGPIMNIFMDNFWKAIIMPFWKNGNIWVHSIPDRPALGVVSAASYFLGIILIGFRYIQKRNWTDLFLLLSIPVLMLPSTLSLAFPDENPSLNRTAAAYIPIFITGAFALQGFLYGILRSGNSITRKGAVVLIGVLLISFSAVQNYGLVFEKFNQQFLNGAWNTSEIGKVIRSFADSIGNKNQAFVVPYAHWVDTRLVGINAGYPEKDFALWPDSFESTTLISGPKLFIIKPEDQAAISKIQSVYPDGFFEIYNSEIPGKEFLMFFVTPSKP